MIRPTFLQHKISVRFSGWKFWTGVAIGVALSIVIALFAITLSEMFRHLLLMSGNHPMIVLSPQEHFVSNFFYSFVATTVGFAMMCNIWFGADQSIRQRIKRGVFVDQVGTTAWFILLFTKLGIYYAEFSWAAQISELFRFTTLWIFGGITLVWIFWHQWMTMRQFVKQATMKVMSAFAFGQVVLALVITAIPIVDYEALDMTVQKNWPSTYIDYELPQATTYVPTHRMSLSARLYIGFSKGEEREVRIYQEWPVRQITLNDVGYVIAKERSWLKVTKSTTSKCRFISTGTCQCR